jgi:Protein of unknown function (DUF4240)
MDKERFWTIVAATKRKAKGGLRAQEQALRDALAKLEPEEIAEFQAIWDELYDEAYTWDLWGRLHC